MDPQEMDYLRSDLTDELMETIKKVQTMQLPNDEILKSLCNCISIVGTHTYMNTPQSEEQI